MQKQKDHTNVPLIQSLLYVNVNIRRKIRLDYDEGFWNKYADENESRGNEEFTKFLTNLVRSLHCTSVLEIGCGTGIDLRKFDDSFEIHGIDLNEHALELAKGNIPKAKFYKESITKLPFEDSSVDFVFTHKLLNYLDDETVDNGVSEMFRVAKRYVLNCELFGETEEKIDDEMKFRNMLKRWLNYKVRVVSNVNMHEDIEPEQVRFTLLRKL
jgi:ubiquinone/menaquinone biosynthesis C-methylase UbiE